MHTINARGNNCMPQSDRLRYGWIAILTLCACCTTPKTGVIPCYFAGSLEGRKFATTPARREYSGAIEDLLRIENLENMVQVGTSNVVPAAMSYIDDEGKRY